MKRVLIASLAAMVLSSGFVQSEQVSQVTDAEWCEQGIRFFCRMVAAQEEMQRILTTDPLVEADAAIVSGEPAFLEINGYGPYVPGFDEYPSIARACRRQNLGFTSDNGSREFHEAQRRLVAYAEIYNRRVAPHVPCDS